MKPTGAALLFVGTLILTTACRTADSSSDTKAVFGNDDRGDFSMDNPFDSVGLITTANGGTCTGFMVGPTLGLTAGHCTENQNDNVITIAFRGDNGLQVHGTIIDAGSRSYTGNVYDDWAFFVLTDGRSNQWLGTEGVTQGMALHLAGFSADRAGATSTDVCTAQVVANNVIYHDCDMQPGASGGPIFTDDNGWHVVGIQSGHHSGGVDYPVYDSWDMSNSNVGCAIGPDLLNKVIAYRNQYD